MQNDRNMLNAFWKYPADWSEAFKSWLSAQNLPLDPTNLIIRELQKVVATNLASFDYMDEEMYQKIECRMRDVLGQLPLGEHKLKWEGLPPQLLRRLTRYFTHGPGRSSPIPFTWSADFQRYLAEKKPHLIQPLLTAERVLWARHLGQDPVEETEYEKFSLKIREHAVGDNDDFEGHVYVPWSVCEKLLKASQPASMFHHPSATQTTAMNPTDDNRPEDHNDQRTSFTQSSKEDERINKLKFPQGQAAAMQLGQVVKIPAWWSSELNEASMEWEFGFVKKLIEFDRGQWANDDGSMLSHDEFENRTVKMDAFLDSLLPGNEIITYLSYEDYTDAYEDAQRHQTASARPSLMKRQVGNDGGITNLNQRPVVPRDPPVQESPFVPNTELTEDERNNLQVQSVMLLNGTRVLEKLRTELLAVGTGIEAVVKNKRAVGDQGMAALFGPYGNIQPSAARRLLQPVSVTEEESVRQQILDLAGTFRHYADLLEQNAENLAANEAVKPNSLDVTSFEG